MTFESYKVPELKRFLQNRGVTCHFYRRDHLLRLCKLAAELNLEVLNDESDELQSVVNGNNGKDFLPIQNVTKWSTNLATLPSIESCDVMVYLINNCGWEASRLTSYKKDNGYKLHIDNHISDVNIAEVTNCIPYFYVKACCVPETRQTEAPYVTWVLLKTNGQIFAGGCSCVVGNGTCKHCVALLFSLVSFNDRHKDRYSEACTDTVCIWDKPKKTSEPMEIDTIDLQRNTTTEKKVMPTTKNYSPCGQINSREVEKDVYNLFKSSNSLLLQVLDPPSDDNSSDDEMHVPTLKNSLQTLSSNSPVLEHLKTVYTPDAVKEIEKITRGQSDNTLWFEHRCGRITASLFPSVMHFRFTDNPENYILKKILGSSVDGSMVPSIAFGKKYEPVARQQYIDLYKKSHRNLNVESCGLFVCDLYPFMGASPDGKVTCKCCGTGLIEIKCSFTYQNVEPLEACKDDHYHLYIDENNDVRLKQTSPWYIQIQGQMGICKSLWCDFIFFHKKRHHC
ncbi:uncharacterized protein LOC133204152 [Saccostrea echinata]|uniref:uncharacterized protein LOC133204152 n=1 Tax=Saccostrea echinata TaxID=191078 RepID=UPI002A8321AA|nr:uncharacterized protein LOC133204152 [Saccostrea echinata]